jgi:hypothetical protein
MAYQIDKACQEIDDARKAVADATAAYRKGGSLDAVNRADRRLANANDRWREVVGGVVPDDR